MKNTNIITLEQCSDLPKDLIGGKAYNLNRLIKEGFKVPSGICISADNYSAFIEESGAKAFIAYELGRKPLDQMRWEEMWDAALRIRNYFLRSRMPKDIRDRILSSVKENLKSCKYAVRSSSNFEDSEINSYAGLHDSFLNVSGEEDIIKCVKLVWASLWSDSAIAYSMELALDTSGSKMSVVIQQMIEGETSGVAFARSPVNQKLSVIEAVPGLNENLVDGRIEPERWDIDRDSGEIAKYTSSPEIDAGSKEPLIKEVYGILRDLEKTVGYYPDLEWTYLKGEVYLLQTRPISTDKFDDPNERRAWDMTLRRSFDDLKELSVRITQELIPEMLEEAKGLEAIDIHSLNDKELAGEVKRRKQIFDKWKKVYWDEFIPFAHGVRLFGEVYNDKLSPDDPYEFVELLAAGNIESVKRNKRLEGIALRGKKNNFSGLDEAAGEILKEFPEIAGFGSDEEKKAHVEELIRKIADRGGARDKGAEEKNAQLEKVFLKSFPDKEKLKAKEILDLARLSYKLRDDDNVYLGAIETQLAKAMELSKERLGKRCSDERSCQAAEEVIAALNAPDYKPKSTEKSKDEPDEEQIKARQLRGQPAGKGIASGKARIIKERADLFKLQKGEILVCDSIDPEMTFIISIAGGIIERRGGMLIHGAIIAREYGIPCVTGIHDAISSIKEGDKVTVDGYYGLVINHSVGE